MQEEPIKDNPSQEHRSPINPIDRRLGKMQALLYHSVSVEGGHFVNKDRWNVDSSIAPGKGAGIYAPVGSDGPEVMWGRPSFRRR